MNKIKVAKELIKLAKNLIALDEEGDGSGFQGFHDYENTQQNRLDIAQKQGKKYILHHKEGRLWRIMACKNFSNVKKGDFGGLIESEENLSHKGNCWAYDDAKIYDDAKVYDNAKCYHGAHVLGSAKVYGNAQVFDFAVVDEFAQVYDRAWVYDNAKVYEYAQVFGKARIYGKAEVDYDVKDKEITE